MAYLGKQIPGVVNDAVNDALGKVDGVTTAHTSDIVSMGKTINKFDLYY